MQTQRTFPQAVAVQASFDPADTLLRQLESGQLPLSPVALWDTNLVGTQLAVHPFNCDESFCGEYPDLQDPVPGPVVNWDPDLRGLTYRDNVLVHHPALELPSSQRWSSHEHSSTHGDPDDKHSQGMLDRTGNSFKRARCMHPAADCASGLRASSLPSHFASNHISSPWRKRMRRGFPCPEATSCSEDDGSPSGTCAPIDRQVTSLA